MLKFWQNFKITRTLKNMYFVSQGGRVGQFLITIDFDNIKNIYSVLALPESEPLFISKNDVDFAIKHKTLVLVKHLPDEIFNDCKIEFNHRNNHK